MLDNVSHFLEMLVVENQKDFLLMYNIYSQYIFKL